MDNLKEHCDVNESIHDKMFQEVYINNFYLNLFATVKMLVRSIGRAMRGVLRMEHNRYLSSKPTNPEPEPSEDGLDSVQVRFCNIYLMRCGKQYFVTKIMFKMDI